LKVCCELLDCFLHAHEWCPIVRFPQTLMETEAAGGGLKKKTFSAQKM